MADQVVDLEEAVGSYLNCLSTSCAAGSKLYTSVGKLVDEKFQELFPSQETKIFFQVLQTQNACEGYQKALLECKDKLLEILIDNHTKRQPTKDKVRQGKRSSPEEQYAGVALRVAKELYCYHQTVAEVLKPLHFSDCQEDIENATLMNIEGKSDVVQAWMTIVEGNKLLRSGYGLSNAEVSQILCWQHGEDMTESSRKRLNQQVNHLIQQYVDRMYNHAMCELDIPIAFSNNPDEIQKILQSCCSPTESLAASSQTFLTQKEEITTMLHRELPRTLLTLNGKKIDKAHPGKAYENATLKMRAVRESISNAIDAKQIDNSKEQVDLFCLRILAMGSLSYASAACRTAVLMAFGKSNLVQVQPIVESDKHIILDVNKDTVNVNINTKWAIVEDGVLFNSLCRGNLTQIATIYVTYHVEINIEQFFVKRITPIPVAHVTQCILQQAPSNQNKKEQGRERSKSIRIKLTRATKLFQRKSVVKTDAEADFYAKDFMHGGGGHGGSLSDDLDLSSKTPSENGYTSDSQGECSPVPPPRHKRKAKKTKKSRTTTDPSNNNNNNGNLSSGGGGGGNSSTSGLPKEKKSKEAKKEDLAWFSASDRFGIPLVPTVSGSKDQSPSIASFEELQGVIDFLSGSSTSSLAINEKGEKIIRTGGGGKNLKKTHKRNNSTTSLPQTDTKSKTNAEGKLKLCHKKSASFSGKASDLTGATDVNSVVTSATTTNSQKKSSVDSLTNNILAETKKNETEERPSTLNSKDISSATENSSSDSSSSKSPTDLVIVATGVERTPGDGMDHKNHKDLFQSTQSIIDNNTNKNSQQEPSTDSTTATTTPVDKQTTNDTTVEEDEPQTVTTHTQLPLSATIAGPTTSQDKKKPYFEPSDITGEIAHLRLGKQSDVDVVKSLPSDLNTTANQTNNILPFQQQRSSTLAALEVSTTTNLKDSNMPSSNSNSAMWQQQQQQKQNEAPSPSNMHPKQTAPQISQGPPRVPVSNLDPSAFEFGKQPHHHSLPQDQQNTLYEPFNSRTAWPVSFGGGGGGGGGVNGVNGGSGQGQFGSRFKSLWSEATLDNEKGFPQEERPSLVSSRPPSSTSSIRSSEMEFTFDKQQDLHKLLEGSSFMKGGYQQNNFQDSWKDRHMSYPRNDHNNLPQSQQRNNNSMQHNSNSFEGQSSADPWPVQSQSNFGRDGRDVGGMGGPRGRDYSSNKNAFQKAQMARMNIESLQLPPNPVGPYMRQNREQLLAKQQILEQFARQQKQMQLQQQQQQPHSNYNQQQQQHSQQQQISFPPSHPKNTMSKNSSRSNMPDRSSIPSSGPPGFNNNSNKFDQMGGSGGGGQQDWPFYQQRPVTNHSPRPVSTQGYPSYNSGGGGGNGTFGGLPPQQTRSVNDVRGMGDSGFPDQMMNERLPPFRDQYNSQVQDVFSSSRF